MYFYMKTSEILTSILNAEGVSVQEFAEKICYPATKLYDIKQGRTKNFSEDLIDIISAAYPKYTREYLRTGIEDYGRSTKEAEALTSAVRGLDKILTEMTAQREMSDRHMTEAFEIIKHFQEQTDRLISLMELKKSTL